MCGTPLAPRTSNIYMIGLHLHLHLQYDRNKTCMKLNDLSSLRELTYLRPFQLPGLLCCQACSAACAFTAYLLQFPGMACSAATGSAAWPAQLPQTPVLPKPPDCFKLLLPILERFEIWQPTIRFQYNAGTFGSC